MTDYPTIDETEAALACVRALAQTFAERLRQRFGERLRRVTLYGSAARGDWGPDSDIDVLVLLDEVGDEDGDWIARQAFRLGVLEYGIVLQPIFLSETRYRHLRNRERGLAMAIEREGIAL